MAGTNTDNSVMQNQPAYSPEGDANFEPSYLQGALTPAPEAKPENVPAPDASSAFAPTQQTGDSQLTQGQQLQNAIQSGSDQAAAQQPVQVSQKLPLLQSILMGAVHGLAGAAGAKHFGAGLAGRRCWRVASRTAAKGQRV